MLLSNFLVVKKVKYVKQVRKAQRNRMKLFCTHFCPRTTKKSERKCNWYSYNATRPTTTFMAC